MCLAFSLIITYLRYIQYFLFPFNAELYIFEEICHSVFIWSPFERNAGYFQSPVIMNKASLNIHILKFVWTWGIISLGYISRNRTVGLCNNGLVNFIRKWKIILQSGCITLHSLKNCMKSSSSPVSSPKCGIASTPHPI